MLSTPTASCSQELNWATKSTGPLFNAEFPLPGEGRILSLSDLSRDSEGKQIAKGFLQHGKQHRHVSRNRDRAGWRKVLQQQTRRHGEFVATMTFLRAQMAWMLAPCRASDYCSHSVPILSSVITRTPAARARMWLADSNENPISAERSMVAVMDNISPRRRRESSCDKSNTGLSSIL